MDRNFSRFIRSNLGRAFTLANAARAKKSTVSITGDRARLRLGWRYIGTLFFSLGSLALSQIGEWQRLRRTKSNSMWCQGISMECFKPINCSFPTAASWVVASPFNRFIQHKSKAVVSATLYKCRGLLNHLEEFFKTRLIAEVSVAEAEKFTSWHDSQDLSKVVLREHLDLLKVYWGQGIEQALVESNSWIDMPLEIKVPPK